MYSFPSFRSALIRRLSARAFQTAGDAAEQNIPRDAASFSLYKEENALLLLLHIVDVSRVDYITLSHAREKQIAGAAALAPQYGGVIAVFLYASAGESRIYFEGDEYFGQSPYAVNWYLNTDNAELSASNGQPSDLFNLRGEILAALKEASGAADANGVTSGKQSPYRVRRDTVALTFVLAAVNTVIMFLMYRAGYNTNPVAVAVRFGAIVRSRVFDGEYYRLFTAMFAHYGWTHLLFNLTGLFIFGTRVERYYGRALFLIIYIFTGLCASVTSLFLTNGIAAGASGAIYGLIGAVFAYTWKSRGHMDGLNNYVALVYIIMGMIFGYAMPNVDYFAHIGGLIAGVASGAAVLSLFWKEAR
uniref:FIG056164: rhomboid family serine protease n=1 Tax=uncultured bacterium contig00025 TaxID=1181514 RepID=A0A806KR36_9BACT|nr:FIG056164: rhomboid family serine protease [uncultured bacterium contig00025]